MRICPVGKLSSCHACAGDMLTKTRAECQQCKDVPRLCAAVAVLCQLIARQQPIGTDALQSLIALTVNKYPKVRVGCMCVSMYGYDCFTIAVQQSASVHSQ